MPLSVDPPMYSGLAMIVPVAVSCGGLQGSAVGGINSC